MGLFVGIDVGGTNLKAGLVDEAGCLLAMTQTPLPADTRPEALAEELARLAIDAARGGGADPAELSAVGIGIPGTVDGGSVVYTCNVPMRDVPLERLFRRHLDVPVLLENDAACAAVGEWLCGAGQGTENFAVITLGTGIGAGVILHGKLYPGGGKSCEVGHMVVQRDGLLCSCGRRGCWEAYGSATGLIRIARSAMAERGDSRLCAAEQDGTLDGKTIFRLAVQGDQAALSVCRSYAEYVALGVTNVVNLFQLEAVAIGGGISGAPAALLLDVVQKTVEQECYGRFAGQIPRVVGAQLGNQAGVVGAALLRRMI